jgi:thiol-disulfide isomerase/thioredoxin
MLFGPFKKVLVVAALMLALGGLCAAQTVSKSSKNRNTTATDLPKVTEIDINSLKPLLKPNGKPLLINFWATWCDPCREEFPDLVKIDDEFRGKIDFITVSLDDLAEIDRDVPRFLKEMKSQIPAYLLHTPDESAAISMVSKDWTGNLPMTILLNADGSVAYLRNGKIRPVILRDNIIKALLPRSTE